MLEREDLECVLILHGLFVLHGLCYMVTWLHGYMLHVTWLHVTWLHVTCYMLHGYVTWFVAYKYHVSILSHVSFQPFHCRRSGLRHENYLIQQV